MSVWLVWAIAYAAVVVAACTLAGTNRRTATHPPCPDCGTPLNPTHWCGKPTPTGTTHDCMKEGL